jgi:hypothetical protein
VAESCGFCLEVADSLAAAVPPLREKTTRAVLVDGAAEGAEQLCQMARVGRFPGDLVVLVGAKKPDDASFAQAYDWGADDVVSLDSEFGVSTRLGRLPTDTALPPRARGSALVAEPDARLAARVERMLGYAGYDVERAVELEPSRERVPYGRTGLVLLSSELGNPVEVVRQLRESGSQAVLLVWSKPDEVEPLTRALGRFDRVAVLSQRAPVESVLFLSNQLMTGPNEVVARTERRFLYGTTVAFREAGADEDDYGFTYNVGPGGIYVRTLAVPAQANVWIELRPPGGHRRVRLAGEVVWRRPFGFASDALAPPGFGMHLSAGLWQDYERWLEDLARAPTGVHAVAASRVAREAPSDATEGPLSVPPDSASQATDSERWFSAYVAPPSREDAFESSVRAPRRRRGASWAGILVAAFPVLLVSAATLYLYARSHPGLFPSSEPSRARARLGPRAARRHVEPRPFATVRSGRFFHRFDADASAHAVDPDLACLPGF